MSVSTRSRSSRSGGKNAPKRKVRRAKSELHGPKKHSVFAKETTGEESRKRVLDSLEHLGHQKLSSEAGGYNLKSWTKSLKMLLDDFEERVGNDALSEEFAAKRREIEEKFSSAGDVSEIDQEIEAVRKQEEEVNLKLKEESERIAARLSAIGGEKTGKNLELGEERKNLQKIQDERRKVSFFSKLVGKSGPSAESAEKKVKDLEAALKSLEEETKNLQALRRSLEGAKDATGGIYSDLWTKLEALKKEATELERVREAKMQLTKERETASEELRKIITELKLESEPEDSPSA